MIHVQQVILPQPVDHAQHDHPLVKTHLRVTDHLLLRIVARLQPLKDRLAKIVPRHRLGVKPLGFQVEAELRDQLSVEPLHVPLIGMHALAGKLIQHGAQQVRNVILDDQLLLIQPLQQLPPRSIHGLTLLVHHVVVLEQVFARLEVLPFHCLLRRFDPVGDHPRLDGHPFFHTHLLQQRSNPLPRKNAHQVVFERQIKSRRSRIALPSGAPAQLVVDAPRLMPLRTHNVQPARRDHGFVILGRIRRVPLVDLFPVLLRRLVFLSLVVKSQHPRGRRRIDRALSHADCARHRLLHQLLTRHKFRIPAKQNVRSASGHVGGNGHHPQPSRLRHDLRLALVILRVQHHVPHPLARQDLRQQLRLFNRRRAHQHRLLVLVQPRNFIRHREVLLLRRPEHHIGILQPPHRHVRRNHHDVQLVNLVELRRFRLRRARHPGKLLVQAKIILEGDRRQRLVLAPDVHAFLRLHRLVQPVRPAPPRHQPPRELIDDDDLAVLHHVLHVAPVQRVRLDGRLHVVLQIPVLRIGDVADPQQSLDLLPPLVRHRYRLMLLIDHVIAGQNLLFRTLLDLLAQFQRRDNPVHARVLVRRLIRRPGNNQRRPRLVDQDRVHLVHNRVIVPALHAVRQFELHVVAQVVEPKFVVRPVGDVRPVRLPPLVVVQVVDDHAHRQPEEFVNLPHPLRIALGQVIVHRHHMNAMPGQCIQITRQRRHQRLAFAGLHLGNLALVQHHAAHQLHVEVPHVHGAPSRLAHHRERLGQQVIERLLLRRDPRLFFCDSFECRLNPRPKLRRLCAQLGVTHRLHRGLQHINLRHPRQQALHHPLVAGSKNLCENVTSDQD